MKTSAMPNPKPLNPKHRSNRRSKLPVAKMRMEAPRLEVAFRKSPVLGSFLRNCWSLDS